MLGDCDALQRCISQELFDVSDPIHPLSVSWPVRMRIIVTTILKELSLNIVCARGHKEALKALLAHPSLSLTRFRNQQVHCFERKYHFINILCQTIVQKLLKDSSEEILDILLPAHLSIVTVRIKNPIRLFLLLLKVEIWLKAAVLETSSRTFQKILSNIKYPILCQVSKTYLKTVWSSVNDNTDYFVIFI